MNHKRRTFEYLLRLWGVAFIIVTTTSLAFAQGESVVNSKHNLSVSGPGPVRALDEDRVCVFCHTPHGSRSNAPLWNRRDSTASYIPYDSPSIEAQPGQPTGASKLCLSCHDGTIAMGDLVSEDMPVSMAGGDTMPPGSGLIGTDLRDDHPISFPYADSLSRKGDELTPSGSWDPEVQLDEQGMLQCTTCHDPHDDAWGDFLVMQNSESLLCRQCHTPQQFDLSPHALSAATWNGSGNDPWSHTDFETVRENACLNCHVSHHAPSGAELLTSEREEEVCLPCHDGSVAQGDLRSVFDKPFRHSLDRATGAHEAGESPLDAADHVECQDCHNPHRARKSPAEPPLVMGVLEGVSGIDSSGAPVEEARYEYEVCFKCHGEDGVQLLDEVTRVLSSTSLINELSPSSPSYHPVEAPGRNSFVPSLISPLTPASMIYCSDCHGSDQQNAGATGVAGPHGSANEFLLKAEYQTGDMISESPTAYALCYECHDRGSILGDESFPEHRSHIVDERTPCSVCHDAHGIDFAQGNSTNNANLINFDASVVEREPASAVLEYESFGAGSGQCTLRCHGKDHSPEVYP